VKKRCNAYSEFMGVQELSAALSNSVDAFRLDAIKHTRGKFVLPKKEVI